MTTETLNSTWDKTETTVKENETIDNRIITFIFNLFKPYEGCGYYGRSNMGL